MLVELGTAFELAEEDDGVRVVILRGAGSCFSAGHDLGSTDDVRERSSGPGQHPSYLCNGGTLTGADARHRQEWHYFFQKNTKRWRNLRKKITIAEVHGMVLSAGLMLAWCCDLIVAGDDTIFADVVGTRLGMCGVEYFGHPWEFGPRKAKELLLTGDSLDADDAHALGMVSKVFPHRRALGTHRRIRAPYRQGAHDRRIAHQGVGESDRRCDGLLHRAGRLLLLASAQSLALGRDQRQPAGHRDGGGRARGLATGPPRHPARRQASA